MRLLIVAIVAIVIIAFAYLLWSDYTRRKYEREREKSKEERDYEFLMEAIDEERQREIEENREE